MKIQLKKLTLTNYRNIDFVELKFDGNSKIVGENRIGKTNTLEAIYYLLTDKLLRSNDKDVSAIKPLKDTKLEVTVEGTFDVDGKEITLKKVYCEHWVKVRGTTDYAMDGHTTTYFYNGIKQSTLRDYTSLYLTDFGLKTDNNVDLVQLLINPFYVGELGESDKWTSLRTFIINMVGDVSDEDVFAKKPELKLIESDMKIANGRMDQLKKKYNGEIDGLKEQIISDEAQIDLLTRTPNPTDEEVALANKGIEEHQANISKLKTGTEDVASKKIKDLIAQKNEELNKLYETEASNKVENPSKKAIIDEKSKLFSEVESNIKKRLGLLNEISSLKSTKNTCEIQISQCNETRKRLIATIDELNNKLANTKIESECPMCHRPYDDETIEKLKEEFALKIESEKKEIVVKGKANNETKASYQEKLNNVNDELDAKEKEVKDIEQSNADLNIKIRSLDEELSKIIDTPVQENPLIAKIKSEIEDLRVKLQESQTAFANGQQSNNELIVKEQEAIVPFQKVLDDRNYYLRQMDQLNSINVTKDKHYSDLADVEQKKEYVNVFIYTKLKMLDENVSKVFGNIKFQLIKDNLNGGFDPICKPYIYNIDKGESTTTTWKSGSKSERVITGIAIAEKIKEHFGLSDMPYLFDEGGEISTETFHSKFKTNAQLICVKVQDGIPTPMVQLI